MDYIDILIPLAIGLLLITSPQVLVKPDDTESENKKLIYKKGGYVLVGAAILYATIKFLS